MSDIEEKPRPGLRFLWLVIVTLVLAGVIAAGVIWSNATASPKLALDLEGGTSIILEPQVSKDTDISKEQLDQAVAIIRQRVDSTGVSEAEITTQGDRNIVVNLPGNPDEETRNLVRSSAQLVFRRVALVGDPRSQEQIQKEQEESGESSDKGDSSGSDDGLSDEERKRIEDLTGGDSASQGEGQGSQGDTQGQDQAPSGGGEVAKPGGTTSAKDSDKTSSTGEESSGSASEPASEKTEGSGSSDDTKVTDSTPRPLFDPEKDTSEWQTESIIKKYSELDCSNKKNRTGGQQQPADKPVVACSEDGQAKYILGPVELSGDHLADASAGYQSGANGVQTNQPAVNLKFDSTGREIFKQITSDITGKQQPYNQFAIELDGLVLSAPTSNAAITDGNAEISGNFTLDSAQTLADQLKNGSLPLSFQVQSEEQISPTLGSNFLKIGIFTGLAGLILVVIYSLLQYRVLGLVTVSSLVVVGVLTYLLLLLSSWRYGYRLSLAGLAGIIIGIGMAADSFIVYFERVRDELRSGRNLLSAVEVGWDRAKRTIYASKGVNMLAAIILYILAVGSVRGFAFTFGLAVIVDVIVVFLFTHPMLEVLARTKFFGQGHPLSGMDPRLLGVKPAAYRGALGLSIDDSDKSPEARRREKARLRKVGLTAEDTSAETSQAADAKPAKKSKKRGSTDGAAAAGPTIAERRRRKQVEESDDEPVTTDDSEGTISSRTDDSLTEADAATDDSAESNTSADADDSAESEDSADPEDTSETDGPAASAKETAAKSRLNGGSIAERKAARRAAEKKAAEEGKEADK